MRQFFLFCAALFSFYGSASAQHSEIYANDGIAINGYDVIAYFNAYSPIKGNPEFKVVYKGVDWFFATKENADLFMASPGKYEPAYGGYCAFGCSRGYKAKTSPDAWTIVNGKLYLNYNTNVRETWNKDQGMYIHKADTNWPKIKSAKYP